ncbi:MAG: hypothetical protein EBX52_01560 [Proteobacteria bacterium]|nr:hypothetical protein [Pseudomonadota bacterium]
MIERARSITAPVLLVFGAKDPAISEKKDGAEARRSIPHAEFEIMSCGHAPFAELPESFVSVLDHFLKKLFRPKLG